MAEDVIEIGFNKAYLDFVIGAIDRSAPLVISCYHRSLQALKALTASLELHSGEVKCMGRTMQVFEYYRIAEFDVYIQPIAYKKEKYFHAVCLNRSLNDSAILLQKGHEGEQLFHFLMNKFDYPLMREWGNEMFQWFLDNNCLISNHILVKNSTIGDRSIPFKGDLVPIEDIYGAYVEIDDNMLRNCISSLFQQKRICISKEKQQKLQFTDMDSYFRKYGSSLVKNLSEKLEPLSDLDGEAHGFTLKSMRLYPQQIAQINGDATLLEKKNFVILNHGMGTGKTITAAAIAEQYFVKKWLRSHPKKTLKDAYLDKNAICYRNIIMCPGHLVSKWETEITREIPYASVMIIDSFSKLLKIKQQGKARNRKEWYIISKDFGKLSYQEKPATTKRRYGVLKYKRCKKCQNDYSILAGGCECGCSSYELIPSKTFATGMVCPYCNQLLLDNTRKILLDDYAKEDENPVLDYDSFLTPKKSNQYCFYCGEDLWQPHVKNYGISRKKNPWLRLTHFANKSHKLKKTVWMHKDYIDDYLQKINEKPLHIMEGSGVRKYAPSEFIKRYMRGFFDIAVFDEAHQYKGGYTGQGHAMHCLIKASKKHMALTGTIAGGYANHLYYLFWRLNPGKMRRKGYVYSNEDVFVDTYGKSETTFEYSGEEEVYNVSCRGKQKGQKKMKPGISPLLFTDFLLDCTSYLDLADMSKYLPDFKEKVITVKAEGDEEKDMISHYNSVIEKLMQYSRMPQKGGKAIFSTMLQFSLSYADKPYGVKEISNVLTGEPLISVSQYMNFSKIEHLLAKERKLIELVRKELAEGRNCFVYANYTNSPETCITYRLKAILENYCHLEGQVEILEASSPVAKEREEWMRKKAACGVRVFITNPRCVETGLDFCFTYDGKSYNYPTIIFYQMGYSLFTIWQASRRSYRLNQTKECRVYYMALENTLQTKIIQLIAEKQVATAAIQGKFSAEGLSAMANGVDTKLKLVQALWKMDQSEDENSLQNMFDVLHSGNNEDSYAEYNKMLILEELIGNEAVDNVSLEETTLKEIDELSLLDMFDISKYSMYQQSVSLEEGANLIDQEEFFVSDKKKRKSLNKEVSGQLNLFNLLGF